MKVGNGTIAMGDLATFTMTVSNAGPGTAIGVTLSDTLPAGLSWTENPETSCTVSSGSLNCSIGTLTPGASFLVTVQAPTTTAQCESLPNTATVSGTNEALDLPANNSASDTVIVECPVRGKGKGFWGNTNGHVVLDANANGNLDAAVTIGGGPRQFTIVTIAESNKILSNDACQAGSPTIFSCAGNLSNALKQNTLENLVAHTLALAYNISLIPDYSGQTVATLGCSALITSSLTALGLSSSSTVNQVLAAANSRITSSTAGGTTTQTEGGDFSALLNCVNQE